jgi:hypothetical protein
MLDGQFLHRKTPLTVPLQKASGGRKISRYIPLSPIVPYAALSFPFWPDLLKNNELTP